MKLLRDPGASSPRPSCKELTEIDGFSTESSVFSCEFTANLVSCMPSFVVTHFADSIRYFMWH